MSDDDADVKEMMRIAAEVIPGATPDAEAARRSLDQAEGYLAQYSGDPTFLLLAVERSKEALVADGRLAGAYGCMAECILDSGYLHGDKYLKLALTGAMQWIDRGLAIAADDPRCLEAKTLVLRFMGKQREAETLARELMRRHPDRPRPYAYAAYILGDRKRPEEAIRMAREALRRAPRDGERRLGYAKIASNIWMDAKKWELAVAEFEKLLVEFPDHAWTWHNASICLIRIDQYEKAYEYSNRALELMEFGAAQEVNSHITKHLELAGKLGPDTYKWLRGLP